MSPFEQLLIDTLRDLQPPIERQTRKCCVSSVTLSSRLPATERNIRHYLKRLEESGRVYRPKGRFGGWRVA
jgi:hypothetical protein